MLTVPEFVSDWKISKQFTRDAADAMPAEFYSFKPNPDQITFGDQMAHIAVANVFRFQQIRGSQPPFTVDPAQPPLPTSNWSKRMLEWSFEYVINALPQITPQQLQRTWHISSWMRRPDSNGRDMILNVFVHTAHHRAQCDIYLRITGVKPPDYTF